MTDIVQAAINTAFFTGKVVIYTFAAGVTTAQWLGHFMNSVVN